MRDRPCPFCKIQPDARGFCGCEDPFDLSDIPQHRIMGLARSIYKAVLVYFAVPENEAKFQEWLAERNKLKAMTEPNN